MDNIRDALLRMVTTARFLKKMAEAYTVLGLDNNPHHNAYGDLMDAIYYLIGEHTEEFDKSVTYLAINAPILTDERRAELLLSEYMKNHPEQVRQPKPITCTTAELFKMFNENGGYMHETPEGDWT